MLTQSMRLNAVFHMLGKPIEWRWDAYRKVKRAGFESIYNDPLSVPELDMHRVLINKILKDEDLPHNLKDGKTIEIYLDADEKNYTLSTEPIDEVVRLNRNIMLLQLSIEHYFEDIASSPMEAYEKSLYKAEHCQLCINYLYIEDEHSLECGGCPIAEHVVDDSCKHTPWGDMVNSITEFKNAVDKAAEHRFERRRFNKVNLNVFNRMNYKIRKQIEFLIEVQDKLKKQADLAVRNRQRTSAPDKGYDKT